MKESREKYFQQRYLLRMRQEARRSIDALPCRAGPDVTHKIHQADLSSKTTAL